MTVEQRLQKPLTATLLRDLKANTPFAKPVSLSLLEASHIFILTMIITIHDILKQLLSFVTLICFRFDFYILLQAT